MQIRKATLEDCEALARLCITTFIQTYAEQNTEENLNHYLENNFNTAQLTQELQSSDQAYFLLLDHELPVAYLKLNYNRLPEGHSSPEKMVEIQRIYVLGEYQQKGLGKDLLQFAEQETRAQNATYLWLGVWERNEKAIRFYVRNGFSIIGTHEFWVGKDCQTDYLMCKCVDV